MSIYYGSEGMFLRSEDSGDLVRVEDIEGLLNPQQTKIKARRQAGEEEQETESFTKTQLFFPSGETLPRCWTESAYQADSMRPAKQP